MHTWVSLAPSSSVEWNKCLPWSVSPLEQRPSFSPCRMKMPVFIVSWVYDIHWVLPGSYLRIPTNILWWGPENLNIQSLIPPVVPDHLDTSFLLTLDFVWKTVVITAASCIPLFLAKLMQRWCAPSSYTKLLKKSSTFRNCRKFTCWWKFWTKCTPPLKIISVLYITVNHVDYFN